MNRSPHTDAQPTDLAANAGVGTDLVPRSPYLPAVLPAQPAKKTGALSSGLRSLAHRNRRALRPWSIAAGLYATGHLLWGFGWALDLHMGVTAVTAIAAAVAVLAAGPRLRRRLPPKWGPWALLATVNAIAWLIATVHGGPSLTRLAWLLVGTAVFGLRWWARIRVPYSTTPQLPTVERPKVDPATEAMLLAQAWASFVAPSNGPVPGALLSLPDPIKHGYVATIQLVRGKQSLAAVRAQRDRIATALDLYPDDLIIERHPTVRKSSHLQLTMVTNSPIRKTVYFDQPEMSGGSVLLGPYADGIGNALYRVYAEDSICNGFILGAPGSGKSRMIETIALTVMALTNTIVVYLDGQDGASSPLLWEHANFRGGREDVPEMIKSLEGMKNFRQRRLKRYRTPGFTPSEDYPGILIIVDECHRIWDPSNVAWWASLAREGRKIGMAILAASQAVTLAEAFAGSDVLRLALVSGNGIAMRCLSAVQQQVFPGLKGVDLTELPKLPGYSYTASESDTGETREAPFRNRFLVDQAKIDAGAEIPEGIYSAEAWFAAVADRQQLDPQSAASGGRYYLDRKIRQAEDQEREDAEFDAMFGDPDNIEPYEADPARSVVPPSVTVAPVIQFPSFKQMLEDAKAAEAAATGKAAPEAPATPVRPDTLTPSQAAAWDAIAAGATRAAEIAAACEVSEARIYVVLKQLIDQGHVIKPGGGQYALAVPATT